MEKEIAELRKEVDELNLYVFRCTNTIQMIMGILEYVSTNGETRTEIENINKYIHENL